MVLRQTLPHRWFQVHISYEFLYEFSSCLPRFQMKLACHGHGSSCGSDSDSDRATCAQWCQWPGLRLCSESVTRTAIQASLKKLSMAAIINSMPGRLRVGAAGRAPLLAGGQQPRLVVYCLWELISMPPRVRPKGHGKLLKLLSCGSRHAARCGCAGGARPRCEWAPSPTLRRRLTGWGGGRAASLSLTQAAGCELAAPDRHGDPTGRGEVVRSLCRNGGCRVGMLSLVRYQGSLRFIMATGHRSRWHSRAGPPQCPGRPGWFPAKHWPFTENILVWHARRLLRIGREERVVAAIANINHNSFVDW